MRICRAGSIPARFNWGQPTPQNTHCDKSGSGYASYKAYRRPTSFPGSRLFKVKSGSGGAERGKGMRKEETKRIYQHYGLGEHIQDIKSGKIEAVNFAIGPEDKISEATANLAGFGCDRSKRIIIEYDKGYGYFMVKEIPMDYGASADAP